MPDCALSTFLSVLAVNSAPAAIVLVAGGVCWATTLALVATLCSGAVTLLSVSACLLLNWMTNGQLPAGIVVGTAAALLEIAIAFLFHVKLSSTDADDPHAILWIVTLHDRLHGVSS